MGLFGGHYTFLRGSIIEGFIEYFEFNTAKTDKIDRAIVIFRNYTVSYYSQVGLG